MNYDKAALGNRYACFQCGTKFYDLNKPEPLCPECGADQREAPVRDIKALLQGGKRSIVSDSSLGSSVDSDDDEFDDMGLDNDDDDDSDDEEEEGGEFEDE